MDSYSGTNKIWLTTKNLDLSDLDDEIGVLKSQIKCYCKILAHLKYAFEKKFYARIILLN